ANPTKVCLGLALNIEASTAPLQARCKATGHDERYLMARGFKGFATREMGFGDQVARLLFVAAHVRFVPKADIGPNRLIDEDYLPASGMKQRICVLPWRSL